MAVDAALLCKTEHVAQLHEWLTARGLAIPSGLGPGTGSVYRTELVLSWEQVCSIELSTTTTANTLHLAPPFLAALYDSGEDDGVYVHRRTVWTGRERLSHNCDTSGSLVVRCELGPRGAVRPVPEDMKHLRKFYRAAIKCGLEAFL